MKQKYYAAKEKESLLHVTTVGIQKSEGSKIAEVEMAKACEEYKINGQVIQSPNVYATRIWNEAIEAAAVMLDDEGSGSPADKIRKLKK